MTLDREVRDCLLRDPQGIAIRWEGQSLSNAEVWQACERVAAGVQSRGIRPGDRVGLCVAHSPALVFGMLGILHAGGVCVPLDPSHPPARRDALAKEVGARLVLGSETPSGDGPVVAQHGPDDLAFIFFTSGSSGQPKGVVQTHRQVSQGQLGALDHFDMHRVLVRSPISTSGIACEVLWPLLRGGAIVMARDESRGDTAYLLRLMQDEGVTTCVLVPSLLAPMLADAAFGQCQSLKTVCCAGEALGTDLEARLEGILPGRLAVIYGTTEAPSTTLRDRPVMPARHGGCLVGWPLATKTVQVRDADGVPVPTGAVGEIYVGGGIATGYWNNAPETARRFTTDRLYRTGDLGCLRSDGSLELLGRADAQVQVHGHRIEPAEVEAVLRSHPSVVEAVVATRDGQLVAWVVGHAELRAFAASRLPPIMVPQRFVSVDALPRNSGGKVDRNALQVSRLGTRTPAGGLNPLETMLIELWQRLLQQPEVGRADDFFALGGDSLLAARMLAEVERDSGVRLPVTILYEHATVAALARCMLQHTSFEAWCVQHQVGTVPGAAPILFFHGDFSGGGFYSRSLAGRLGPERSFYAIHPHGLDGRPVPYSIQAMGRERTRQIESLLPGGRLILGGHCNGGMLAYEVACRLRDRVDLVFMIDPALGPRRPWWKTWRRRTHALAPMYFDVVAAWQPRPYAGAVTSYYPREDPDAERWSQVAPRLQVVQVPGGHLSMLTEYQAELAEAIRDRLSNRYRQAEVRLEPLC